jgi:hypothetical protein
MISEKIGGFSKRGIVRRGVKRAGGEWPGRSWPHCSQQRRRGRRQNTGAATAEEN